MTEEDKKAIDKEEITLSPEDKTMLLNPINKKGFLPDHHTFPI